MDLLTDSLMLNQCMNWDNILNNDALCERAALDAAKLLNSTSFLTAALDDESLYSAPQAPNENGYFERSEVRASGGAEPSAKRARLDDTVLFDLDAAPQPSNGTQDDSEKEYFDLQPISSYSNGDVPSSSSTSADFFAPPPDVHDILYGLDDYQQPSTSAAVQPLPEPEAEKEEDQWVNYYYELDDPHPDLLDKVKAQMAKSEAQIAKIDAEFTAALIEKATIDQMLESTKKKRVYKEPGKKDIVMFVCLVCSRGFLSTDEMQKHVEEAHLKAGSERDFKCRFCRRSFARRQKLEEHERKHTQPGANFACDKCPAFYTTKDSLERHLSDKHGCRMDGSMIEAKKLACPTCGKQFGVKKELQYHGYYCGKEDAIAEKKAQKKEKERLEVPNVVPAAAHSKVILDKSCPICGLVTASMQSRNRHIQRKHPEKYFEVMENGYRVYSPTTEQLAARPFACAQCDHAFANRAALSTHERRVHGANPSKMYYCGKCGNGYPLPSELRKHEKKNEDREMCRGRGRGDRAPSTPSSSISGLSSRASSLTPCLMLRANISPLAMPVLRPSSNTPISLSDLPNPDKPRMGRKPRVPKMKVEGEEEEEMEVEETPAPAADEDDAMMDGTLDEEIAADEARQQFDTLDDFEF